MMGENQVRLTPKHAAPDTYLIQEVQHALGQPLSVYINSAVILGTEPVIVDTGSLRNRTAWLDDVFSLVDPEDVRWVFLSHDDADHTANVGPVMEACPNATLVCSWALVERFANAYDFPLSRCRWVNHGDAFTAGDRALVALRPPVYDSPTTRGLLDTTTGVYWAVDAFATPVPGGPGSSPPDHVKELDPEFWRAGMVMYGLHGLSPWLELVDSDRYMTTVREVQKHGMSTILSAHSPVIDGVFVDAAFDMVARLAGAQPPPCPDQSVLEALLGAGEGT
jgi:hypothetical protein